MLKNIFIFTVFFFLGQFASVGNNLPHGDSCLDNEIFFSSVQEDRVVLNCGKRLDRPNPIVQLIRKKQRKNKKITAAVLAFPFPFGIVGLHRIYLGSAPYVPVVYIATVGGVFGILPFIDFCALVLDKDIDRFINNDKVFMWVK